MNSDKRSELLKATGYYLRFALRGNTKWNKTQSYIHTKKKKRICDVEILFYSFLICFKI